MFPLRNAAIWRRGEAVVALLAWTMTAGTNLKLTKVWRNSALTFEGQHLHSHHSCPVQMNFNNHRGLYNTFTLPCPFKIKALLDANGGAGLSVWGSSRTVSAQGFILETSLTGCCWPSVWGHYPVEGPLNAAPTPQTVQTLTLTPPYRGPVDMSNSCDFSEFTSNLFMFFCCCWSTWSGSVTPPPEMFLIIQTSFLINLVFPLPARFHGLYTS